MLRSSSARGDRLLFATMADVQHDEPVPELKEDIGGEVFIHSFGAWVGRLVGLSPSSSVLD